MCVVLSHEHRASLDDEDAQILARMRSTESSEASDKHPKYVELYDAPRSLLGNSYCLIGQVTNNVCGNPSPPCAKLSLGKCSSFKPKRQHWSTRPRALPILPKSHFPLCCKLQILGLLTGLCKAFNSSSPCISHKRTALPLFHLETPPPRPGRSVRGVYSLPWTGVVSRVIYTFPPSYMFPIVALLLSSCCSILVVVPPKFLVSE